MNAPALRPRSAVEIIDAAFHLMRRNYLEMLAVGGVIIIPLAVLEFLSPPYVALGFAMLRTLFSFLAVGAILHVASEAYLGQPTSVGGSLRHVARRMLPLVVAVILQTMLTMLGFVFLIIPGFFVAAWLFTMPAVVVLEGKGPLEAIGRSYDLARGYVGKILGIVLLTYLIYILGVLAIGSLVLLSGSLRIGEQSIAFLSNVLSVLILPIWSCIATLLYYDLRIRKEGFDLQVMAQQLEGNSPVAH